MIAAVILSIKDRKYYIYVHPSFSFRTMLFQFGFPKLSQSLAKTRRLVCAATHAKKRLIRVSIS